MAVWVYRERDGEFSPWLPLGGLGVGAVLFYEVVKDSASKYLRNIVSHTPLPQFIALEEFLQETRIRSLC